MRASITRLALLLTASLSAAVWSACGDSGSDDPPASAAAAVIALFNKQLDLFRAGDFDALYANYSEDFRERCAQEALIGSITVAGLDADKLAFEDVNVVVEGEQARLTYVTIYDGERVGEIDLGQPDVYTRTDGRWYDEFDTHTHC